MQLQILLTAGLLGKHCLVDGFLQTPYQRRNKAIWGHPGGIIHAGMHAVASFVAIAIAYFLLEIPPPIFLISVLCFIEFVIHYHSDWIKTTVNLRMRKKTRFKLRVVTIIDQSVHVLTYICMVIVLSLI